MKLIALKDFARVPALAELEISDKVHDNHIHKGAIFDIGKFAAKDLRSDPKTQDKLLVAQLIMTGCVGDATDAKVVKAVEAEIEQDRRKEENAKKLDAQASGSALVAQLTALAAKAAK